MLFCHFRFNLDPLGKCSDEDLWTSLEIAQLRATVTSLEAGLGKVLVANPFMILKAVDKIIIGIKPKQFTKIIIAIKPYMVTSNGERLMV